MSITYLITRAGRGIGLEYVRQLSAVSTNIVIATVRSTAGAAELVALSEKNENISIVTLDVGDDSSVEKLKAQVAAVTGKIDVFVSNAALNDSILPVLKTSAEEWLAHYRTNTLGPILVLQQILPFLKKGTGKKVAFISSGAGSMSNFVPAGLSGYGQSTAEPKYSAVQWGHDLAGDGFAVIALHPGVVPTLGADSMLKKIYNPQFTAYMKSLEVSVTESVSKSLELIESLEAENSGKFYQYDGALSIYSERIQHL